MPLILPVPGDDAPIILPPTYRYAGDDWRGANALQFVVYAQGPTLDASGFIIGDGVPRPLDGCTVIGTARFQQPSGSAPAGAIAMTGVVLDVTQGLIALELPAARTVAIAKQDPTLWQGPSTDPRQAPLVVQPGIRGADGRVVSIGMQPVFVF